MMLVETGAALGACLRYLVTTLIKRHSHFNFPWATLLINLSGAFCLGFLTGSQVVNPFLGAGFMGGFTTFSTFNTEVFALGDGGLKTLAVLYLVISYLGGLALALAGLFLGKTC